MQQTTKYQFKLIEGSDDFSPQPLNDNAEKVEEALQALETSVAQDLETLETSVAEDLAEVESSIEAVSGSVAQVAGSLGTTGHNARMVLGSYAGNGQYGEGKSTALSCQFYPVAALIVGDRPGANTSSAFLVRGCDYYEVLHDGRHGIQVSWQDNGLSWYAVYSAHVQLNRTGYTYRYLLLGYDQA